jgi:hypothetical protein
MTNQPITEFEVTHTITKLKHDESLLRFLNCYNRVIDMEDIENKIFFTFNDFNLADYHYFSSHYIKPLFEHREVFSSYEIKITELGHKVYSSIQNSEINFD